MDLSTIGPSVKRTDLLNRSGVSLFLVIIITVVSLYYSNSVDEESERTALMSELSKYEQLLQTELQHLIDLIYRSSDRVFSPDTPAIASSFPWVRGIGLVRNADDTEQGRSYHLLTLSLAEVSRSLGGQITFATVNDSDVLLVLSKAGQDHTVRAIFSTAKLVDFINTRISRERLDISLKVSIIEPNATPPKFFGTVHFGLPGLEAQVGLSRGSQQPPIGDITSLTWILIGSLWAVWLLMLFERRRRLRHQELIEDQKQRIEAQAGRTALAEITSSIGHEINQPVAAIESLSDTTSLLIEQGKYSDAADALQKLQTEAIRVGQIIQAIRRLSSTKGLTLETLDLSFIVQEIEALAKIICKDVRLIIKPKITNDCTRVLVDRTAIEQVIINLVANASEAFANAKSADAQRPSVELSVFKTGHEVVLRVSDNGTGIDSEIREQIFDSFISTKSDGVGLGLNLARSIAEKHRGWLHLVETSARGTTFELRLPAITQPVPDTA